MEGLVTPFNLIAELIVIVGLVLLVIRFTQGLGAVTAASQDQPWGLLLNWGLFSGVPLSASGFVLGTAVYLLGLKKYHPVVKNAILVGFLGYLFAVIFLLVDLGRPWRLPYPMVMSFGTASVLFLVAWHVFLYLSCQFLEFFPSVAEWGGWRNLRRWALAPTIGLTIFGVILSTLHQSALGAMFLLAPGKLHPLWYSQYIPALFLISAIAAGLCMVIFVSFLTQRFLRDQADSNYLASLNGITLGLGKAASFVLITYFGLKMIALAQGDRWDLLNTPYGYWFLTEMIGFVLLPCFLFVFAVRERSVGLVQFTAILTIVGVIINRFNVSLIALNWTLPQREFFNWKESLIVIAIITMQILVYRWIVNRMPVLREQPEYKTEPLDVEAGVLVQSGG
ncbi:MAG: polysulfide reductase NrfD [Chloroflexi bacterium]|nr:polysulfide reductase NrfD [Chloroflexota bacterium]